jgi:hypothetical protein
MKGWSTSFRAFAGVVTLTLLLAAAGQAKADVVYTISQGNVSAQATFTAVPGGIEIAVVNTEANTMDAAQAISQLQFTINTATVSLPTSFTRLTGMTTDFGTPPTTAMEDSSPPAASQHWGFSTSGTTTVNLVDVSGGGLTGPGGQPNHLITATGSTPNSSLAGTHIPSFIGEVDFFLAATTVPSNLTTNDITGVKFSFGTGPETLLASGTGSNVAPVPEPASVTLLGTGVLGLLGFAWRRRKQVAA